jgi:hypothetical protein
LDVRPGFGRRRASQCGGDFNIYIVEINTDRIRKIDTASNINTIAGTGTAGYTGVGGPAVKATLSLPQGVAVDGAGNVYFADNTFYVRKIDTSENISTFAGNSQSLNLGSSGPPTSIDMVPTGWLPTQRGNIHSLLSPRPPLGGLQIKISNRLYPSHGEDVPKHGPETRAPSPHVVTKTCSVFSM